MDDEDRYAEWEYIEWVSTVRLSTSSICAGGGRCLTSAQSATARRDWTRWHV